MMGKKVGGWCVLRLHVCVCVRLCVCDGRLFSVLLIPQTTSKPEPTLRGPLSEEEGDFEAHLSSLCQGASFNPGTFLPSLTHTHTHTKSDTHSIAFLSSASNENPKDLHDTNNSTQHCVLGETVCP